MRVNRLIEALNQKEDSFRGCSFDFFLENRARAKINGRWVGGEGFHISSNRKGREYLDRLFVVGRDYFDKSEPTYLDLGSGTGITVIHSAYRGWRGNGIEIDMECHEQSKRNISESFDFGIMPTGSARCVFGNFFPREHQVSPCQNKHFRKYLENADSLDTDPYESLGISLDEVDLFYHFQIESHQNILDFFARFARKDALLFFNQTHQDDYEIPPSVKEIHRIPTATRAHILYLRTD